MPAVAALISMVMCFLLLGLNELSHTWWAVVVSGLWGSLISGGLKFWLARRRRRKAVGL